MLFFFVCYQALRCKEDELMQQKIQQLEKERTLEKIRKELEARELELVERELNMMIPQPAPTPKRRRNKVSKSLLKVSHLNSIPSVCLFVST